MLGTTRIYKDYYADLKATNIEELLEPSKAVITVRSHRIPSLAANSTAPLFYRDPHVLTEAQTILAALCYLAESGVPTQWFKSRNYLPSQAAQVLRNLFDCQSVKH